MQNPFTIKEYTFLGKDICRCDGVSTIGFEGQPSLINSYMSLYLNGERISGNQMQLLMRNLIDSFVSKSSSCRLKAVGVICRRNEISQQNLVQLCWYMY